MTARWLRTVLFAIPRARAMVGTRSPAASRRMISTWRALSSRGPLGVAYRPGGSSPGSPWTSVRPDAGKAQIAIANRGGLCSESGHAAKPRVVKPPYAGERAGPPRHLDFVSVATPAAPTLGQRDKAGSHAAEHPDQGVELRGRHERQETHARDA